MALRAVATVVTQRMCSADQEPVRSPTRLRDRRARAVTTREAGSKWNRSEGSGEVPGSHGSSSGSPEDSPNRRDRRSETSAASHRTATDAAVDQAMRAHSHQAITIPSGRRQRPSTVPCHRLWQKGAQRNRHSRGAVGCTRLSVGPTGRATPGSLHARRRCPPSPARTSA